MPSSFVTVVSLGLTLAQVQDTMAMRGVRRFVGGTVHAMLTFDADATGAPTEPLLQLDGSHELRRRSEDALYAAVEPELAGLRPDLVTVTSVKMPAVVPDTDSPEPEAPGPETRRLIETVGALDIAFSIRTSESAEATLTTEAVQSTIEGRLLAELTRTTGLAFSSAALGPLSVRVDDRKEPVLAFLTVRIWTWINTPLGWGVIGGVFGVILLLCVVCICVCDRRREARVVRPTKV